MTRALQVFWWTQLQNDVEVCVCVEIILLEVPKFKTINNNPLSSRSLKKKKKLFLLLEDNFDYSVCMK